MTTQALGANSYSQNAAFWIDIIRNSRDRYRTELTNASVLSLVGPQKGMHVLDAGCGEGYLSRALAEQGAKVIGVDMAVELVEAAQLEADQEGLNVKHLVADICHLPRDLNDRFDVALLNHVVNDLENPAPAFTEAARVLRPKGRMVILMLHPCFTWKGAGAGSYFSNHHSSRHFEVDGTVSPTPVSYWVRPLESYSALLTEAGFAITRLQEPRPSEQQLADPWWQAHFTTPKFLLIEATKLY